MASEAEKLAKAEIDKFVPAPIKSRAGNDVLQIATFTVQKGLKVGNTIFSSLELTVGQETKLVEVDLSETPYPDDFAFTSGAQYFFPTFVRMTGDNAWRWSTSIDSFHSGTGDNLIGFRKVDADTEKDIPVSKFRKFRIASEDTSTVTFDFEIRGVLSAAHVDNPI